MAKRQLPIIAATALSAVALTACGGSTAPGVTEAPSAGSTQASVPKTTATPTSGPLAKKPVIAVPKTPAPTHLVVKDLVPGTGSVAQAGKTITVNYVGTLYNGREFDSSWSRNQTFTTALANGQVITGWVKGIAGMKVGGRRELIIPPSEAYGKTGQPPKIPPNSTLIFVVDLLSVS